MDGYLLESKPRWWVIGSIGLALILGFGAPGLLIAQQPTDVGPASGLFLPPPTGPLRERQDQAPVQGWLERRLPFDSQTLRVRGEFREQYESWRNREFGFGSEADNDYLLQRLYLDFDLQLLEWLRVETELGSSFQFGSPFEPSPIDEDPFYFQQLLTELTLLQSGAEDLSVIFGRQTFSLGSGRLVAIRNGPNVRRSFDALRIRLNTESFESQLLFASDVEFGGDVFDNEIRSDRLLWGNYTTLKPGPSSLLPGKGGLDLYYLGYQNNDVRFDSQSGDEVRHSFGTRLFGLFGEGNRWDYNIEPVMQVGSIDGQEIRAFTVANVIGYTFDNCAGSPRLGIKFDVISGDLDPNDGRLETFNAYFPNNSYFSEAAIFAPANLYDLNLSGEVELTESINLVVLWDFLWRYSVTDAVYVPPGVPGIAGASSDRRFIGDTISIATEWRPCPALEASAAYVHLEPGDVLDQAGAGQSDFFLLWTTLFF